MSFYRRGMGPSTESAQSKTNISKGLLSASDPEESARRSTLPILQTTSSAHSPPIPLQKSRIPWMRLEIPTVSHSQLKIRLKMQAAETPSSGTAGPIKVLGKRGERRGGKRQDLGVFTLHHVMRIKQYLGLGQTQRRKPLQKFYSFSSSFPNSHATITMATHMIRRQVKRFVNLILAP